MKTFFFLRHSLRVAATGCFLFLLSFVFLGLHPWHMEVPRLGVKLKLQLPAYTTATATADPNHICDLHHSSLQCQILNPLNQVRDRTRNLMVPSRIHFHCIMMGTADFLEQVHMERWWIGTSRPLECWVKSSWVSWTFHLGNAILVYPCLSAFPRAFKSPYNGILSSSEKEWSTDTHCNIDKPWKHYAKWKKPDTKRPHLAWFHLYEISIGKP